MIRADDPRVTAYALGEADETDRAAVEAALAVDTEVRDAVEAVRAAAQVAAAQLAAEGATGLTDEQRARVLAAANAPASAQPVLRSAGSRWTPFVGGLSAAAAVLVAVSIFPLHGGRASSKETSAAPASGTTTEGSSRDSRFGQRMSSTYERDQSSAVNEREVKLADGTVRIVVPGAGKPQDEVAPEPARLDSVTNGLEAKGEYGEAQPGGTPRSSVAGSGGEVRVTDNDLPSERPAPVPDSPAPAAASARSQPASGPTPGVRVGSRGLNGVSGAVPPGLREPQDPSPAAPPPPTTSPPPTTGSGAIGKSVLEGALRGRAGAVAPRAPGVAAATPTTPGLPAGQALNPTAGAFFGDGRDGDFRGRAESGYSTSKSADTVSQGEAYDGYVETEFLRAVDAPLSTFSVDVDTASYANVRRMLRDGARPPPASVRLEEMVNYFRYAYPAPAGNDPLGVHVESATCPWNVRNRLVRVAVKAREIEKAARPAMNLVFLIDVSGSMNHPNKLPLVQASMRMLLEELQERDTVAIVTYAGSSGLVLPPTSCEKKAEIQKAIDELRPGGSTNGAAGIQLAYQTARESFVQGGANRVVLATDGDFNVGVTSRDGLLALIEQQAKSGVFLTCLGYGMGNLKDATLEMLADKGNGNYGYVDSTREARKVLVDDASGTLVTVAKDVKLQVEFNPATVEAYRLVGYDNRRLAARDFADDTKDAGEVGGGHAVTVFYEVVPVGGSMPTATGGEEPLRYGPKAAAAAPAPSAPTPVGVSRETLVVKLRWKEPAGTVSTKREFPYTDEGTDYAKASPDFRFAAAVAAFALVLKESAYRGTASLEAVAELATEGLSNDAGGYRAEFVELVNRARSVIPERGR